MTNRRFNWFLIIRLAGIVLFIVVLSRTDLRELWGWMKQVERNHLLLAIFFQFLLLMVKALRWYNLNETGFDLKKLKQRSGEFFEGYAMGVITPGRVGELMKAGHGGSRSGILGAGLLVIAERGMDLSIYFVIAGIAISHSVLPGVLSFWGWLILFTGTAGMFLSILILMSPALVRMTEKILKLFRVLGKSKSMEFYHRGLMNSLGFFFLSLFSNLSYFVCCYFLATGVGMDLPVISVSGGVATAGVMNTIPITVMGLGTREVTLIYIFQDFPLAQVMAFSGLVFLIAQIGGGIFSLLLGQILLWKSKSAKKS
ncbi:MAG: flippase-like domain-containing protein [Bacteroidales bacterium]|nr:flippase-like domain-containing protein [Bacteroidales bacterium]